jgi:putative spermidine/putrescine transport system permease protein
MLLVVFAMPLVFLLKISFTGDVSAGDYLWRFLSNGSYLSVLITTLRVSFVVSLLCLAVGYPTAYFIYTRPPRQRPLLLFLVLVPMWMSILIRTYDWMLILGRQGLVNSMLLETGLISGPLKLMYTSGAVDLVMVQVLLPFMVITCFAGMSEIDDTFVRAARILGASPRAAFLRVFLPLSLDGAINGFVLVFMLSMGFFIVPALIGGPKDTMMANFIELQVEQADWGFSAALSMVLLAATLVVMAIIRIASRRFTYAPGAGA